MTEENALATVDEENALTLASLVSNTAIAPIGADDEDFNKLAVARNFLPRINLLQATSKEAQGNKKKGVGGEYLLTRSKEEVDNLKEKFIAVPLAFRFKAVDMRNKEKILSYYDQKSDEFNEVKKISKTGPMTGCMAGIEFLFWMPEQDCFATWYASSTTALGEAQSIRAMIGKGIWMKSNFIEAKTFSWYGPKCTPCSETIKNPDMSLAKSTIETFINPKSSEVEAVTEGEQGTEERAR